MGILKRLSVALGLGYDGGDGREEVSRLEVEVDGGSATLLVRQDPSGVTLAAVDGRFVMRLNLDAPELPALAVQGAAEQDVVEAVGTSHPDVSTQAVRMAVERLSHVLDALGDRDLSRVRDEVREGIVRSDIALRRPVRADVLLSVEGGRRRLHDSRCEDVVRALLGAGVLDLRLVSPADLGGTVVWGMARAAREAGMVVGVMAGARRVGRREVLEGLVEAGVGYLELLVGVSGRGYERGMEAALRAASTDGIEVVPVLAVGPAGLEPAVERLERLVEAGATGVGITAMLASEPVTEGRPRTMSLGEYEEVLAASRKRAEELGTLFYEICPIWVDPQAHAGDREVLMRCTAADNSPSVWPDGSIRPCLHSSIVMGRVDDLDGLGSLHAPIRTMTDQSSQSVDRSTLCLSCLVAGAPGGDRRRSPRD